MGLVVRMSMGVLELILTLKNKTNPVMISDSISHFIINSLRDNSINLYEAYLINMEAIKFERLGYTQIGWNSRVRISTCLALLNQKLLSDAFDEHVCAKKVNEWAMEAYQLNREKRLHFIMDRYYDFLEANQNTI